ncbi:MAG: GtrA family protein [Terriglobales bacterium]
MNDQRSANGFAAGPVAVEEVPADATPRHFLLRQFFRFGVVGVVNTVVDLAVLNLLIVATDTGRTGAMFAFFKTVAFVCAVANSYLMNRSWTFDRVTAKSQMLEGSQFLIVNLLGLLLNVGTSWYAATYTHPIAGINPKWWPSLAALVGTAFSLGFNFVGYKFWVFAHRKH